MLVLQAQLAQTISMNRPSTTRDSALAIFREHGGMLRTSHVLELGVHPETLYRLRDTGDLVEVTRGLYRLADLPELGHPDLVAVASRIPSGVICLISALSFHGITTEVPHEVQIALAPGAVRRRVVYPPTRVFQFSGAAFEQGIEIHPIDGLAVKVYGPEKTVADCFRFRNKIGLAVAVEALRLCRERRHSTPRTLLDFARIDRVERVMMPYLEAVQ
jgi:predicted transcriptional regulator of viral defense system